MPVKLLLSCRAIRHRPTQVATGAHLRDLTVPFLVLVSLTAAGVSADIGEVSLSKDELARLDTFEGHTLAKADQTFHKKQ